MKASDARTRLHSLKNDEKAAVMRRFFKTGPGQYGAGDLFLGVPTTPLRQLAREFQALPLADVEDLLHSGIHEERVLALLILVRVFPKAEEAVQRTIYEFYLRNTSWVNNWDLVDASAEYIVGDWLLSRGRRPLVRLAKSSLIWERRIAVVATYHFIKRGEFAQTLKIAALLLSDEEDLIHKAVGWMLREVGKRDEKTLETFLVQHYRIMPRTMLRYAIERFPEPKRKRYLHGKVNAVRRG